VLKSGEKPAICGALDMLINQIANQLDCYRSRCKANCQASTHKLAPQKVPFCRHIQGNPSPDVQLDQQHPPTHSPQRTEARHTDTLTRRTGCGRHTLTRHVQPCQASRHRQSTGNQWARLGDTGHRVSVGQPTLQDQGTPTWAPLWGGSHTWIKG
jgi:hypothetical protein